MTEQHENQPVTEEDAYMAAIEALEGSGASDSTEGPQAPEQEPEHEAQPSEPEGSEDEPQEQSQEQAPFEGFESLTEAQQAAVKAAIEDRDRKLAEEAHRAAQYENQWKSQRGQLAPIQRQAMQLLEENKRLQAQLQSGTRPDSDRLEKLRERFRENFPDDAEALDAFLSPTMLAAQSAQEENDRLRQEIAAVSRAVRRQHEVAELSQAHPDWQKQVKHIDGWINLLDPADQELAAQWRASESAQDNIRLLNMYKRDRQLAEMALAQQQGGKAPQGKRKRPDVDPSPRNRQSLPSATNGPSSAEEERYIAALESQGIRI